MYINPKKIAIVGHGYVGRSMERLFRNHYTLAFHDPAQGEDNRDAVNASDVAFVCVPTPQAADGSADLRIVCDALEWIQTPLIVIKSTVPPGTTDELAVAYGERIHFSPEFVGESRQFVPFWKYPNPKDASMHDFVIVGGPMASAVLDYFTPVMSADAKFTACSRIEAELTKYMDNAFLATKVTFCNEFSRIAGAFGVDYKRLRELWLLDSRVGPSHTLIFDEPGFGGKCLPKDISAIIHAATAQGYHADFLRSVVNANTRFRKT